MFAGERIAIQGLADPGKFATAAGPATVQVQMNKSNTLQLSQLSQLDPSKLTVLQELPDVGKVVIHEPQRPNDTISNILEDMKTEDGVPMTSANNNSTSGVEYSATMPGESEKKQNYIYIHMYTVYTCIR